jgi:hypothetical protein
MARRIFLALAAVFLAALVAWVGLLAPRYTQRLPPGWRWTAEFIGTTAAPTADGTAFAPDTPSIYSRALRLRGEAGRPRAVVVEDSFTLRDPATNAVTWEYKVASVVDPATGEHLDPAYRGQVLVFPRGTQRTTYRLRTNYLKGVPMRYEGVETVEGLRTYRFRYAGPGEYTESYRGSGDYAGVSLRPGEQVRCDRDALRVAAWVEPVTGAIVKWHEACPTGDYVFDAAGRRGAPVLRWAGTSAGDDLLIRADDVRAQRRTLLWVGTYAPILLGAAAALCLLLAFTRRRPAIAS